VTGAVARLGLPDGIRARLFDRNNQADDLRRHGAHVAVTDLLQLLGPS
jgi:hypothetical protein